MSRAKPSITLLHLALQALMHVAAMSARCLSISWFDHVAQRSLSLHRAFSDTRDIRRTNSIKVRTCSVALCAIGAERNTQIAIYILLRTSVCTILDQANCHTLIQCSVELTGSVDATLETCKWLYLMYYAVCTFQEPASQTLPSRCV